MNFSYTPSGVCSRFYEFEIEDHKLVDVKISGGCSGNLQGISSLIRGMDIDEVIDRLQGIQCGFKPTSCPDQIAKALKKFKQENP